MNVVKIEVLNVPKTTNHAMANGNTDQLEFASCQNLKIQADFKDGEVTSDGGLLLLREVERRINLFKRAATCLPDSRDPDLISHTHHSQLAQPVMALAQGYEDLNDHDTLRQGQMWRSAPQTRRMSSLQSVRMDLQAAWRAGAGMISGVDGLAP